MFARNQKDLAESLSRQMLRFSEDFIDTQGDPQDRIISRETAILTIVDALVGEIQRREQAHGAAKVLQCEGARGLRHGFKFLIGFWRDQMLKALDQLRLAQSKAVQSLYKR